MRKFLHRQRTKNADTSEDEICKVTTKIALVKTVDSIVLIYFSKRRISLCITKRFFVEYFLC